MRHTTFRGRSPHCVDMHLDVGKLYKKIVEREIERERDLLPHEMHSYLHRQQKKSQHADTVIATRRGTAPRVAGKRQIIAA